MALNRGFSARLNSQTWVATEGQKLFTISNGRYTTGKNLIEVFIGGVRQDSGDSYDETSITSFTLTEGAKEGDIVEAKWFENSLPSIGVNHSQTHKAGGQDELNIKDLAGYDNIRYFANIKDYGAIGNGVNDDTIALQNAINSGIDTVFIPKGTYLIKQNLTVPAIIKLVFARNAKVKVDNAKVLTINGNIEADSSQWIFDLSAGGSISGSPKINAVYPQWFGAIGDYVADDTIAINGALSLAMNSLSNSQGTPKYAQAIKLIFLPGRYRVTSKITLTRPANSVSNNIGRGFQIIIEGAGTDTSIELDQTDGTLFEAYDIAVVFKDIALWAVGGTASICLAAGKNDATNLYELRQSRFINTFFRASGNCIKVNRIFDSSFQDCFFALTSTVSGGIAFDVIKPTIDNSNNINMWRCHFEGGSPNGTWIRVRGDAGRGDGYHHGFNFNGCHFETRAYSMKILDIDRATSFAFHRCQMTQNGLSAGGDSNANAVNMIVLSNSSAITFTSGSISRQNDVSTAPLLVKADGFVNAVTFQEISSATAGNRNGGRSNFIDDSTCTTKRGISLKNCMLTTFSLKPSNDDRLIVSSNTYWANEWQLYNSADGNNNLLAGFTNSQDLLAKGDEQFGFSSIGQFKSKYGFTGTNTMINNGATFNFIVPTTIEANRRGLYMFYMSDNSGIYYGLISKTENVLIPVFVGSGVSVGTTSNPATANKLNVWMDTSTGAICFQNNLTANVNRYFTIIPFTVGSQFN